MSPSAVITTRILLLGPPRIERDNAQLHLERRKAIALLAYLAMSRQPHTREELAALFWPDHERAPAHAYLRNTLWTISRALGDEWAEVEGDTVRFNRAIPLDVNEFTALIAAVPALADDMPPDRVRALAETLTRAAALYRGDFLSGFSLRDNARFEEWQFFQAEELRRSFGTTLQRLAGAYAALGEHEPAIAAARRWLALDQLHEPAHRLLMTLYERAGQHTAALRQYREVARLLAAELDTAPEPETTRLYEAIQARRLPGAAAPSQGRAEGPVTPLTSAMPVHSTPFIGRDDELAQIARLLADPNCRLLTLVGPGGIGKTRLAMQVGANYPGGGRFVSLAPVCCGDFIVPTIASALGIALYTQADQITQLQAALRDANFLLVLDNFEHLNDSADLLPQILGAAPALKILVTSRERLNLQEEWLFEVGGLAYPQDGAVSPIDALAEYSAIRLFVQSARRLRPGFRLIAEDAPYITDICRFTEGAPLAIELAAAWTQALAPREIAQEVHRSIDFLATTMRNVPERHRSLRAVFENSWNTLTPDQQAILARLSIFQGGFTPEAAGRVSGASLYALLALVGKSLLRRAEGRFEMHELLRQFADQKLTAEERASVADRHCDYYTELLHVYEPMYKSHEQPAVLRVLSAEIDNLRAAWRRAVEQKNYGALDRAFEMLALLYMNRNSYQEGLEVMQRAAAALPEDPSGPEERLLLGRLLAGMVFFEMRLGRYSTALENMRHSAALLREFPTDSRIAPPLLILSNMSDFPRLTGEHEERYGREALALFEAAGDRFGVASALNLIGTALHHQIRYAEARDYRERALALARQIGQPELIVWVLSGLAATLGTIGLSEDALRLVEEALPLAEVTGDRRLLAIARFERLCYAEKYPDDDYTRALLLNLKLYREFGDKPLVAWTIYELGWAYLDREEYADAETHLLEAQGLFLEMQDASAASWALIGRGMVAAELGDYDRARRLADEALRILGELEFPWARAGACYVLGDAALGSGDQDEARRYYLDALLIALDAKSIVQMVRHLTGIAKLFAAEGDLQLAAAVALYVLDHTERQPDFQRRAQAMLERAERELIAEALDAARLQAAQWSRETLDEVVREVAERTGSPKVGRASGAGLTAARTPPSR